MQSFLKHIFQFLIFFAMFYIVIICVWGTYAMPMYKPNLNYKLGYAGHLNTRLKELKTYGKTEVLCLGSSHTYRGFDTRIFQKHGFRTFNLGSSSQTPLQTEVLVNRYLDSLQPKIVIFEVYPPIFGLDGVESSLDLISNDMNDMHSLKMAWQINHIKTYNTLIYGYICNALGMHATYSEPLQKEDDTYISGGYIEKTMRHQEPLPQEPERYSIQPKQITAFSNIMRTLKKRQIEVILVFAPVQKVHYESLENKPQFDSLMCTFAPYFDFNKIISLDDSLHFYDAHHLNQLGVELFNESLFKSSVIGAGH